MRLIYFVHDKAANAIKIGLANDPRKRLAELQVGCAHPLVMLVAIPGGRNEEAKYHQEFARLRLRGEWFRAAPELMDFAKTIEAKKLGPFLELVELEPALWKLYEEAKAYHGRKGDAFCANAVWYGYPGHNGIKPRLIRLVGYLQGGCGRLRTSEAYDIAYQAIYDALPDCRGDCECTVFLNAVLG